MNLANWWRKFWSKPEPVGVYIRWSNRDDCFKLWRGKPKDHFHLPDARLGNDLMPKLMEARPRDWSEVFFPAGLYMEDCELTEVDGIVHIKTKEKAS
jgi:hypothetical protein